MTAKTKPARRWVAHGKHANVFVRHEAGCPAYADKRCRCAPGFRAEIYNRETKRPDKSESFRTVDEAIGWAADRRRGLENPKPKATSSSLTVDKLMATFIAAARAGTARRKGGKRYADLSIIRYERNYTLHLAPHVGVESAEMTPAAWQAAVENVCATGQRDVDGTPTGEPLSDSSVHLIFSSVRAAYRWAAAPSRRIVSGNPLRDVEMPAGNDPQTKRVTAPETIPTLLGALRGRIGKTGQDANPAIAIAWAVMFYAGLRISEVIALDWADVDLRGGWLTVGESKTEAGARRRVPIVPELAATLRAWQLESGARLGPVAPGARNVRLGARTISGHATKRWARAGLPHYSPHEARHTFASVMAANRSVSLAELQAWLGHTSLATTAIYVKTLPGHHAESVHDRLAGSFRA